MIIFSHAKLLQYLKFIKKEPDCNTDSFFKPNRFHGSMQLSFCCEKVTPSIQLKDYMEIKSFTDHGHWLAPVLYYYECVQMGYTLRLAIGASFHLVEAFRRWFFRRFITCNTLPEQQSFIPSERHQGNMVLYRLVMYGSILNTNFIGGSNHLLELRPFLS